MLHLQESFYNIIMDSVSDMVFVMQVNDDKHFTYHYLNRAALNNIQSKTNIIGKSIEEVNTKENATLLNWRYESVAHSRTIKTYQDTHTSKEGKPLYFDTTITPLVDEYNHCIYLLAVVKDVTHRVKMTKKLEESEVHLQIIAENVGDLVTLINDKQIITFASPSYKRIIGFDHKPFIGKHFSCNIHPDDQHLVNKMLTNSITLREAFNVEFRQFNQTHQWIWSASHGVPVFDHHTFKHMVIVTRDISEQKQYESKLEYFALHDSLTGLPNRRSLYQELANALDSIHDQINGLAVIMLDIDKFKYINDELGHDIGDEVIIEFGRRISNTIGRKHTVARLGGDEFVILLSNIENVEQPIQLVKDILETMQEGWNVHGTTPEVTTSIGIGLTKTGEAITPNDIIKLADVALYEAKNMGGNTYKVNYG